MVERQWESVRVAAAFAFGKLPGGKKLSEPCGIAVVVVVCTTQQSDGGILSDSCHLGLRDQGFGILAGSMAICPLSD